jgi:uncharacterized damage-inducible protein DinB
VDLTAHFRRLLRADLWANRESLASLQGVETPPAACARLLAHIFAAEHLWHGRLTGEAPRHVVWPEFTLPELDQHFLAMEHAWDAYIKANLPARFGQTVAYKNSKGELWNSTPEDILTHVALHSAHHRGQIALQMRQAGFAPAYTDFIHGVRQGLVKGTV